MTTIVNYGVGNVRAIANIYHRLGIPARLAATSAELAGSERVILPGVGAFDWAMSRFNDSGMRDTLNDLVVRDRKPVLGICVGMQMMGLRSDEGVLPGLGWIDGQVRRFDERTFTSDTRLPHMGWNDVEPRHSGGLFEGLESLARFYFLHSYYFAAGRDEDVLATTDYSGRFAASVRRDNVWGVQFHPEKSHAWGIRLLKNFASL